ncbi:type II secretion system protein GspF, partial [Xanthomonas euvesicatoria pv. euvesicatoria]|nr:type II secretion system protein GspF [Xanthomonas euvesicatoria pv. euvesicatoria]
MPQFDYTVLDLHGRNRHGVISADSVHGARALLEQRQWVPVRLEVAAAAG